MEPKQQSQAQCGVGSRPLRVPYDARLYPTTAQMGRSPRASTNTSLSIFSPGPFSGSPIWRCLSPPSPGSRLPFILPGEDNLSLRLEPSAGGGGETARPC